MKKLLVIVLAIVMVLSVLAGCSPKTEDPVSNENRKTKVTYALQSFESLDPFNTTGHPIIILGYQIYETLWTVDEKGVEVGVIAKDWTIDGKTIDVNIYDYIYDSAGNHITADDVVFCYNTWLEIGTARNTRYFTSVTKTGDYSLRIELNTIPYVTLLSGSRVFIVAQAAYEAADADFVNKPIATGHYTVREFVSGSKAVFEKRDSHWQSDKDESLVPYTNKANADVVQVDVIIESQQIQTALETGSIQAGTINVTIAEAFASNDDLQVVKVPGNYAHAIMFNCYNGPFVDNLALRQAVMYAIDTEEIALAVTKGTGHKSYTIGDENLSGYLDKWEDEDYYNFDLAKAKELMAEAGYPDGGLTLRWLGKTDEFVVLTAQVIQAQLAKIGITLEIESLDNTSYMQRRPAYSESWDLVWGDSVPKGNIVLAFQSYVDINQYEQGNQEGVYNEEMQAILEKALYGQKPEDIDALHQMVKELAFVYGSYVDYNFYGAANGLTMKFANDGEPIPCAFVLDDDYAVFDD